MHSIFKFLFLFSGLFVCKQIHSNECPEAQKVVLITGASRGIGFSTAQYLAGKGYRVYATSRSSSFASLPSHGNIRCAVLDVADSSTVRSTVSQIIEEEGRLDIVINNAGYALGGPVECLTMEEIKEQMDVNFFGIIRVCQEVLPHMREQKAGRIINISSEQGVYGLPYGSLYTASKAALESFSEALSIEVAPWNITVSIVEPGFVATEFFVKLGSRQLDQNPYQDICQKLSSSLKEKREPSESCQSSQDIAQFLYGVIEDPHPQLRYQTSKAAEEVVSLSIKDLSGKEYTHRMRSQIEAWLSNH